MLGFLQERNKIERRHAEWVEFAKGHVQREDMTHDKQPVSFGKHPFQGQCPAYSQPKRGPRPQSLGSIVLFSFRNRTINQVSQSVKASTRLYHDRNSDTRVTAPFESWQEGERNKGSCLGVGTRFLNMEDFNVGSGVCRSIVLGTGGGSCVM